MMQKRIIETIDSDGKSTFTIQRKWFGFWWMTIECGHYGNIEFNTYKEANEWVCYVWDAKRTVHKVECINESNI